ncbi:hypothetical protein X777_10855 [Ooceraea biroi]|uniref:Uncharacterized protein n=1 Tax=Ooceraea biroi TaxID=2015173 RepID=A0A026W5J7_OOCBI|nr:hypothetical protein X777_10855 [Ooceraea biroi]
MLIISDVLDKIKAGLQYASNYLETAKDIADLVSKSLGHKQKQKQKRGEDGNDDTKQPFGPSNLVSAFFRLIGFDSQKIVAVTINSVVFLAQMISSLFGLKTPQDNIARSMDGEKLAWDPLKFTLENRNGADSACIRLLLCKSSPVIKAAQNSLGNKSRDHMRLTAWLPSKEEFETNSDECEDRHSDCSLFPSR